MFSNIFYNYRNNTVHLWEYINEKREYSSFEFSPYCYILDSQGDYKDLRGNKCKIKTFPSWKIQREFTEKYETFEGDIHPEDRTLIDRYHNIQLTTLPNLNIQTIDIETKSDKGFPKASDPENEITLITVYSTITKKYHSFGIKDYTPKTKSIEYQYCDNEEDLLRRYFKWHKDNYPDIITGWNSYWFDIPYILERAKIIISENFIKKYSPIDIVEPVNNKRGISYKIAGISQLDFLDLYKNFSQNEREEYKLHYIANLELGEGKLEFDGELRNLWKNDWEKFVNYNIKDVYLVNKLEKKLGYIKLAMSQSYICKVPFEKFGVSIKKFDNFLMSLLKEKKIVLPSVKKNNKEEEIPGGYVSEPRKGYYEKVVSYDFTSLYPHIIMALNISPETYFGRIQGTYTDLDLSSMKENQKYTVKFVESSKEFAGLDLREYIKENKLILSPNGVLYSPYEGFIPKIIKYLYAKRKEYKDKMKECERKYIETKDEKFLFEKSTYDSFQHTTKITLNSAFGILANEHYRLYNIDSASAITLMGQKISKFTGRVLEDFFKGKFGISDVVLAQDTDSAYLNFTDVCKKIKIDSNKEYIKFVDMFTEKHLSPHLQDKFLHFSKDLHDIEKNYFDLKRESICVGAIFIQKKKYALYSIDDEGVSFENPKIKIKGMEIVRSSTPSFCREKIKDIVELIFKENNREIVIERIKQIKKEFKKQELIHIAFPRNVKDMSEYISLDGKLDKGTPIHVRASRNYNELLKKKSLTDTYEPIYNADKIRFIYLLSNNYTRENIIAFKNVFPGEFNLHEYIDYDTQFEKSFMSPILTICEAMGWSLNLDANDLKDFF